MPEKIDLIDQYDTVIGTATREECHRHGLRHRAVHILIFTPKGEIFLQKRSKTKDVFPNLLEASLSGHVKSGETYEQAAVRELKEELGIKKHAPIPVKKFKMRVGKEHEIIKIYTLRCDCTRNLSKITNKEVASGKFIPFKKLKIMMKEKPENFTPGTLIATDKYEEKIIG